MAPLGSRNNFSPTSIEFPLLLPPKGKHSERVLTRPVSAEVRGLVLLGHGGPAFVDVAAKVEVPRRAGFRGRTVRRKKRVGTLRRERGGLIVMRHGLRATVAVRSNSVEME